MLLCIFTFSSYEMVLVLCETSLLEFLSNLYVSRPRELEKKINYRIEFSFGILYRSRKNRDKLVNQPIRPKLLK